MPMTTPELLPTKAVAELYGLDRSTIARKVERGELVAAAKVPGRTGAYLFDPAELTRVLGPTKAVA